MSTQLSRGSKTSAAEIGRNFGHWQDRALQEPVVVTHHGRPRVVLMAADEYFRLSAGDPKADRSPTRGDERQLLLDNMSEGFVAFDHELRVVTLNISALANSGLREDVMVGRLIDDPRHGEFGKVLSTRFRRVLRTGEAVQFETRGLVHSHRIYAVRAFPYAGGVAMTFAQLTELYDLRLAQEAWTARARAMQGVAGLMEFSVTTMGLVEKPNDDFCRFLGFSAGHVEGTRLVDFVAPSQRDELGDAMNRVLQGRKDAHAAIFDFVLRVGQLAPLQLSFARALENGSCSGLAAAGLRI